MTDVLKKDIYFEPVKGGIHAGGQHAQKNSTGVRATHIPTGVVCVIRSRSLQTSKRRAVEEIRKRVRLQKKQAGNRFSKARWREAIKDQKAIRTYHFPRGVVKDHRTGVSASIKDVMDGDIDLLQTLVYFEGLRRAELERKAEYDSETQRDGNAVDGVGEAST